ncbi:NAD(P)-binding protein [Mycena indigotica]|uniref:NAD(P)-binding protein n=1 Tax=Mycena indigotica TaxID=2126181 RepID=A0A8H6S6C7_9AGAR|nr:NAD(P)-binding protein [Mycena indigotica]KAF7292632.1 NAD(P)-binding protein [Mycena indigotica]
MTTTTAEQASETWCPAHRVPESRHRTYSLASHAHRTQRPSALQLRPEWHVPLFSLRRWADELEDYPIPGETTVYDETEQIDLDTIPLNGGLLAKVLVLSVDPYLRGRMRSPEKKSYNLPFTLGEPIVGYGIAVVLRSETEEVKPGQYVQGPIVPFQEYAVFPSLTSLVIVDKHPQLPLSVYIGAAGMPGQTAYAGWKEHSEVKPGEVVFVSTGAGPVGSFVIQLAKAAGAKVIASAGSEEKVAFIKSLGADFAFNYKTTDTKEVLAKEGPIDIYWDNVGGEILDAAIDAAAVNARFIVRVLVRLSVARLRGITPARPPSRRVLSLSLSCPIFMSSSKQNLAQVVAKTLHIHGILVFRLFHKYAKDFYAEVPAKLVSGEIKYTEEITKGLDKAGHVILAVQKGENKAKAVVLVAEE